MKTQPKPRPGGRRPGAGRPPADPLGARRKITIYLSPAELAHCLAHGGSAPAWIRQLLATSIDQG